jgi:hypothetical protein
LLRISGDLTWG